MTRTRRFPVLDEARYAVQPRRRRRADAILADAARALVVAVALATAALCAAPAANAQAASGAPTGAQPRKSIVLPMIEPQQGRRLFVTRGCVICHSVKGVGGRAAPALDAQAASATIDVLDFVARMWRGAPVMLKLQDLELGYQIKLAPSEIADLAGFVSDADAQTGFSLAEVPEVMREWMVNDRYWEDESIDWREKLPEEFPMLDPKYEDR